MRSISTWITSLISALLLAATASALAQGYGMMGGGMMGNGAMGRGGMHGRFDPAAPSLPPDALASASGRLFVQTCSRCHAVPDPQAHSAGQWPAVVSRMELHMRQAGQAPLDKKQIDKIDSFLEQHASIEP